MTPVTKAQRNSNLNPTQVFLHASNAAGLKRFPRPFVAALVLPFILFVVQGLCCCFGSDSDGISESSQYGTPGKGKILVHVTAMAIRPGRYYIKEGTTLGQLLEMVGGIKETPTMLNGIITITPADNPAQKKDYVVTNLKALRSVRLKDGDRAWFWRLRL